MQNLLVDIYKLTEVKENGETVDRETELHMNVPARKLRLSGSTRYLAAGTGVALSMRIGIDFYADVSERCRIANLRNREGDTLPEQPTRYRVVYVEPGERRQHMELDLEALRDESA